MERKWGVEELVLMERKIFWFLVFYLVLSVFLATLFVFSGFWTFMETAIAVLAIEIMVTGTVKIAKPLNTKTEIEKEIGKISDYKNLRDGHVSSKNSTIKISISVYLLVSLAFLLFIKFSMLYAALLATGAMVLYFSVYLFFRYKLDRITVVFLKKSKAIS